MKGALPIDDVPALLFWPTPNSGFGHRFWAIMTGIEVARVFFGGTDHLWANVTAGGGVALVDHYWNVSFHPGRQSKQVMGPPASYPWADTLLPVPRASELARPCVQRLKAAVSQLTASALRRGTFRGHCVVVDPASPTGCYGWCKLAGSGDRSSRTLRMWRQAAAARLSSRRDVPPAAIRAHASLIALLGLRHTSGPSLSAGAHMATGSQSTVSPAVATPWTSPTPLSTPSQRWLQRSQPNGGAHAHPARVVWHLRTGDATVDLHRGAVERLKTAIDAELARRGTEHVVLTYDGAQLQAAYPWLEEVGLLDHLHAERRGSATAVDDAADTGTDPGLAALRTMLSAHVLISTGSSFSLAAAALAPIGAQVHLFWPPKELGMFRQVGHAQNGSVLSDPLHISYRQLQEQAWYRMYFMRDNTVPVDFTGAIFPPYSRKFSQAVAHIDARRTIPPEVASACYEPWLADCIPTPNAATLRMGI